MDDAMLTAKDSLCPLSGMGRPPETWSACVVECGLYDATTGYCSIAALWHLRELMGIEQEAKRGAESLEDIAILQRDSF